MERYICIHGHFYQPPRENPWLEAIELQDSAYPYHDWNERVTAECYAPNSRSRILDPDGFILQIVNNYARTSFNFGPTLLAWLERNAPAVYAAILEADRASQQRFSGHGSALAQAYNHMILPLANARDKYTQVHWGILDFVHRFGRRPEGMWLPETAVDLETLEILARLGVKFTVLSPHQAAQVRSPGSRHWLDVDEGRIDPTTAYRLRLRSRRSLSVFFYDGPISRAIAFEDLLARGENLAHRLESAFSDERTWPQLVHIATDGETYGHHRAHGDMALAYALHYLESRGLARLTNYGEFLEQHPPTQEVRIFENSSWSCIHGVERWRSNCGCNSGSHPDWSQEWRGPLRAALDWLRDTLAPLFEKRAGELLRNPWEARNDYIAVVLDRSAARIDQFLARHGKRDLALEEKTAVLKLLELQRHCLVMYTSCGWFFDELSGIETTQIIQYAARALQLARERFSEDLEEPFLARLEMARSNLAEHGDGRRVYQKFVKPAVIDLSKVAAHYAVSALFDHDRPAETVFAYSVEREAFRLSQEGRARLALGRIRVTSQITLESQTLTFGVLHLGDHNVFGGVREFGGEVAYASLEEEMGQLFRRGDLPALIRAVDGHFGAGISILKLLFRDEQRKIVRRILESAMSEAADLYRSFYRSHGLLVRSVSDLGIPLPKRFQMAVDFTLNTELQEALSAEELDLERIGKLLEDVKLTGVSLDTVTLEFSYRKSVESLAELFRREPENLPLLEKLLKVISLSSALPFRADLWHVQNLHYELMQRQLPAMRERAQQGDEIAPRWVEVFSELSEKLMVRVE